MKGGRKTPSTLPTINQASNNPAMQTIPLVEKVPEDYRHIHVLFGRNGYKCFVVIDGKQEIETGCNKPPATDETETVLDWLGVVITQIRLELGAKL